MALPKKKKETASTRHTPLKNNDLILKLMERVEALESQVFRKDPSINRVETFNGETEIPAREETNIKMGDKDKLQSMVNAIKILPPNYVVDGRHSKENVSAICGFKASDDMMDKAYAMINGE